MQLLLDVVEQAEAANPSHRKERFQLGRGSSPGFQRAACGDCSSGLHAGPDAQPSLIVGTRRRCCDGVVVFCSLQQNEMCSNLKHAAAKQRGMQGRLHIRCCTEE